MPTRSLLVAILFAAPAFAADPTPEQAERFEKQVRPLLVANCFECHSKEAKKVKGGLRVDGRKFLLEGGDTGPAIVPGDPAKSKLIEAVKYGNKDLLMPPEKRLPAEAVAVLEAWIKDGAPWPNDTAVAEKKGDFDLAKRKESHWAWKPLPLSREAKTSADGDQFIRDALKAKGLTLSAPADKLTLLRRVTFALTGLPPTPAEIAACESGTESYEQAVDRLLASPAFGERWGRHWLDLVRYAETRGHEFEPEIPNAYQYRDYVIRALNADVPYNQFVKEHLAGDCLPDPRIDAKTGVNESVIGSAFWHLGEEVHSPVDIRQDEADRFDNRIDVATKTFLGLTVACARCHDHKFDAIGNKDYYALFGLLEGSTYRQIRFDGWKQNREVAKELAKLRADTDASLQKLTRTGGLQTNPAAGYPGWLTKAVPVIDYAALKPGEWLPDDVTFGDNPRPAGFRYLRSKGDKFEVAIEPYTAAVFDPFWAKLKLAPNTALDAGALGRAPRAGLTIRTPSFVLEKKKLHYLVRGGGMSFAAVGQQAVIAGPLHGSLVLPFGNDDNYRWVTHDVSGYVGQRLHVELTADPKTPFAVAMVVQADDTPPIIPLGPLGQTSLTEPDDIKGAKELVDAEKELAKKAVWESRQVVGMWDGPGVDSPVFVRGNPRTPGPVVPHRSLEAIHGPAGLQPKTGSGRLELAEQWVDPKTNPFVPRVMVNRVWHHLFGRGIVASTDNFGVLGEAPTHPELLDALAVEFTAAPDGGGLGWSVKKLIRKLVLTDTYRQSSAGSPDADKADPSNLLLHKFRVKRLEGEAIRDAMLSVSGRLDTKQFGPSVLIHLTEFLDGRGKPGSGPVDGDGRRSVYIAVRRNFLSPFLMAFDTPIPFSTVGRRQVSNVPGQALILLNDPFVHGEAERWGKKVLATKGTTAERVEGMYLAAFARRPTAEETQACAEFVAGKEADPKSWGELAHTLFNVKEFVFVR